MTVKQLIEKLQTINPSDEVLIELNHDELVSLSEAAIETQRVTKHNRIAFEEEEESGNVRRVAVIRA